MAVCCDLMHLIISVLGPLSHCDPVIQNDGPGVETKIYTQSNYTQSVKRFRQLVQDSNIDHRPTSLTSVIITPTGYNPGWTFS